MRKGKGDRDFAASYLCIDAMAKARDWNQEEETMLRKEKAIGGKIDDVTIVVGIVYA